MSVDDDTEFNSSLLLPTAAMSRPLQSHRSKDAPMDYEWTNRASTKPAWSSGQDDPSTPRKRQLEDSISAHASLKTPATPTFGRNNNVPFLFNTVPLPQTPHTPGWEPSQFSSMKATPQTEIHDIDMNEVTPSKPEEKSKEEEVESESTRPIALGGLRRVFKQRRKARGRSRRIEDHEDSGLGSTSEEDEDRAAVRAQNTSNHYTLNMPAPPTAHSETPYVLLGYLQFFFNLSLVLLFLYLVVQFILTVQVDVEKRISEYSQDIVQDIAQCAAQFQSSFCGTSYMSPALVQQCSKWESCMNRDPTTIGRARVSAELIAEVINGFVEPISWKTLIFTLTSLGFLTVFINALLSLYRSKYQPVAAPAQQPTPFPIHPTAPFPHHFGGYMSPAPTPNWSRYNRNRDDEDTESPTRRRRLEGGIAAKIK